MSTSRLVPFDPARIFKRVTFRIDEDTANRLRSTSAGLARLGLQPTDESDLLRFAVRKLDEAVSMALGATRTALPDPVRVQVGTHDLKPA